MRRTTWMCVLTCLLLLPLGVAHAQIFTEQGACSGTSATVSISSISYVCSTSDVSASGSWSVTGASAVRLDYYIDGTLYQSEIRSGSSGTWSFYDSVSLANGSYSFDVDAFPVVQSSGVETVCLQHGATDSGTVQVASCPVTATIDGCTWNQDPTKAICYPDCSGHPSGGTSPYTYTWGIQDTSGTQWQSSVGPTIKPSSNSPTGSSFSCRCGYAGIYDTVVFKVDDSGSSSDTAYLTCSGAD